MIIDSKNYRNKLDDCVQNKYRNHTPTDSQTTSFHPPGTLNMNTIILNGRVVRAGKAEGEALVSPDPIGFLGGIDPQTGAEQTASFYTCNACGGDTWKLTNPLPINLVSLLFFGFMLFASAYGLVHIQEDIEFLIFLPATAVIGYLLYRNSRKNSRHWKKFKAWERRQRL